MSFTYVYGDYRRFDSPISRTDNAKRTGQQWHIYEDFELAEEFCLKLSLTEIAQRHERQIKGVYCRLIQTGLIKPELKTNAERKQYIKRWMQVENNTDYSY